MIQEYEIFETTWKKLFHTLIQQKRLSRKQEVMIQAQLQSTLTQRVLECNRNRSTSMPLKKFKQLRKGMFYLIDHGLPSKGQETYFYQKDIATQLILGETKVQEDIEAITKLWLHCRSQPIVFQNERYVSILEEQIPKFLHSFDAAFFPHQCIQDLDYPLWDGLAMDHVMYEKKGSDLVKEYLRRFALEQDYSLLFQAALPDIIARYENLHDVSVQYLGINLCNILMPLHLCSQCLPQPKYLLAPDAFEYVKQHLETYQEKDWQELLLKIKEEMEEPLFTYIQPALLACVEQVKQSLQDNYFDSLMLQEKIENDQHFEIEMNSEDRMMYEQIYEEICELATLDEKINYLNQYEVSIVDRIDLFENHILFEDEFFVYFKQCSQFEIAIYLYVWKREEFVFHHYPTKEDLSAWQSDIPWQHYLILFLQGSDMTYWLKLTELFKTIKFSYKI